MGFFVPDNETYGGFLLAGNYAGALRYLLSVGNNRGRVKKEAKRLRDKGYVSQKEYAELVSRH